MNMDHDIAPIRFPDCYKKALSQRSLFYRNCFEKNCNKMPRDCTKHTHALIFV